MTEGERETLAVALDHAWRWYENQRGRAHYLMQILVVWLAILGTAYGVTLQARLYGIGGCFAVLAALSVVALHLESSRLRASAELAARAVAELQSRLADALDMEAMRLQQREDDTCPSDPRFLGWDQGHWLSAVSIVVALAGALYTWVMLP
ncbi:hypothetical protein ABZ837_37175 [Streptomyces sp. NPDC047197]|uniref:hypothetical protein n=1 Tax=Streptomyces sp. NPDC047197 TaxID=3155477 RepID=UPI0034044903